MSVKLHVLAEMDKEYAEMLKQFFSSQNVTDYLDMTVDDFIQFCAGKVEALNQQVMEVMKKRGDGRNRNL